MKLFEPWGWIIGTGLYVEDVQQEIARIETRVVNISLIITGILVVLLLRIMDAFKVFDIIFMLTYGGPGQRTEVLSLLIYKTGLKFLQIGQASAMSWLFLAFIFIISFFFIRELQRGES